MWGALSVINNCANSEGSLGGGGGAYQELVEKAAGMGRTTGSFGLWGACLDLYGEAISRRSFLPASSRKTVLRGDQAETVLRGNERALDNFFRGNNRGCQTRQEPRGNKMTTVGKTRVYGDNYRCREKIPGREGERTLIFYNYAFGMVSEVGCSYEERRREVRLIDTFTAIVSQMATSPAFMGIGIYNNAGGT